jgi:hypothetical protein
MMPELPEQFCCDRCHGMQYVDLVCWETRSRTTLLCLHCCACPTHGADDPGGRVVWDTHGWRGLGSEHQARRHT